MITQKSIKKVQSAEDALNPESTSLRIQTINNVEGSENYSASQDCVRILQQQGSEGAKAFGLKREKRENKRAINNRFWHVRPEDAQLFQGVKFATIVIPEEGVSFKDMYQYHCCPELGVGRAALRRFPCNCPACDEQIRMDWDYG